MRASKENAAKALEQLGHLERGATTTNSRRRLATIREFLQAAQRKLPSEAAYNRVSDRKERVAK